jgi:hypothetical protein
MWQQILEKRSSITVKAGQTKVHIDFDKNKVYKVAPVITATAKALIDGNYAIVNPESPSTNLKGFDLVISVTQTKDV